MQNRMQKLKFLGAIVGALLIGMIVALLGTRIWTRYIAMTTAIGNLGAVVEVINFNIQSGRLQVPPSLMRQPPAVVETPKPVPTPPTTSPVPDLKGP